MMPVAKHNIGGSDYVGAFACVTDKLMLIAKSIDAKDRHIAAQALGVRPIPISLAESSLVGMFARANSNGIILSSLVESREVEELKSQCDGIRVGILDSNLNAIGNNIMANDKFALVNPEYSDGAAQQISDILGVEVVKMEIGGFKTVGANNVLTNKGIIINNRTSDKEKEMIDKLLGMESIRTTANTGSLSVGLSTLANSTGLVVGDGTTGYELARIVDALNIE
jgi:translation initiation factor 6